MIPVRNLTTAADVIANYKRTRNVFFCPRKIALARVQAVPEPEPAETIVEPETPKPPTVFPEDLEAWQKASAAQSFQAHGRAMQIVRECAERHGVSVEEIFGRQRKDYIAHARQDAMAQVFVALWPQWSLIKIGIFFGRDHTTVIHAAKKMKVWKGGDDGRA